MRPPMAQDEIDRAIAMYRDDGLTYKNIGLIIGRDPETVRRNLKKSNVVMRSFRDYYAAKIDENFFGVIDTQEKAYWLGFLAADACISESAGDHRAFHFVLKRADHPILKKFKEAIGYSGRVNDFVQFVAHRGKSYEKSGIWFNNKKFCTNLLEKGWFEFKKNDQPDKMLSFLGKNLIHHFIRGFFDGDGCISKRIVNSRYYFSFAGSQRILSAVRDIVVSELGFVRKDPRPSKHCKSYSLSWNGNRQVTKFGQWLYKDASVWLERKKSRFQILFDKYDKLPEFEFDHQNNFYYPLAYGEIAKLSQERKDTLIKQFEERIAARPWIDPSYPDFVLTEDLARIQSESLDDYKYLDGFRSRKVSSLEFAGRKLLTHFQPHYWTTRCRSHMTLVEGWNDSDVRHKAVSNMFNTRGSRPSLPRYLRELNFAGAAKVSHFHPGLAKAALQHFTPGAKTYLDPCAGWGARLLAAHLLGLDYTACDPNHKTMDGLHRLASFVGFNCNLLCQPFERFIPDKRYDIAFTSPPYFNLEKYHHGEQSYQNKKTYGDWVAGFLIPLVTICRNCADKVVLHVSPKIKDSLMVHYPSSRLTPVHMQRVAGGNKSAEWFVEIVE